MRRAFPRAPRFHGRRKETVGFGYCATRTATTPRLDEAGEHFRDVLERGREMRAGALDGAEHHDEQRPSGRGDRGARGVRRRRSEGALVVGQEQPAAEIHSLLADAGIALAVASDAHLDRALDPLAIVETERKLVLERAEVAHVHGRQDARQPFALQHATQQRLAARADLGGIDVELVEQRAGLGDAGDVGRLTAREPADQLADDAVALDVRTHRGNGPGRTPSASSKPRPSTPRRESSTLRLRP